MRSNKNNAINTLDHRLLVMGFSHPDSTKKNTYVHRCGDKLEHRVGEFGRGWYWYRWNLEYTFWHYMKKSAVKAMEATGRYAAEARITLFEPPVDNCRKSDERPAEASVTRFPCL